MHPWFQIVVWSLAGLLVVFAPLWILDRRLGRKFRLVEYEKALAGLPDEFGRLVRIGFFLALAIGIWVAIEAWDTRIGDTPLAQLTLNQILAASFKAVILLGLYGVWMAWAFAARPNIRAWRWFGAVLIAGALGGYQLGLW